MWLAALEDAQAFLVAEVRLLPRLESTFFAAPTLQVCRLAGYASADEPPPRRSA